MKIDGFKMAGVILAFWVDLNLADASQPHLRQVFHKGGVSQVLLEGESKVDYYLYASSNLVDWQRCLTAGGYSSRLLPTFNAPEPCSYYRAERIPAPLFLFAIAAKEGLDLNSWNLYVDSFNSTDPQYSTNGQYNSTKRRDRGDLALAGGLTNSIYVGSATILGHVLTSSNAPVMFGPQGAVGNLLWDLTRRRGIQPSWYTNDLKIDSWDVERPPTGGYLTPSAGTNAGTYYDYILSGHELTGYDYALPGLTDESMYVTGNAVLHVLGTINCSAQSTITIASNSSLTIYMHGADAYFGGVVGSQSVNATNFAYFGLPENTNLVINANQFTGTICAPSATLTLSSTNIYGLDFVGACVVSRVRLNTRLNFHYDENLLRTRLVR